MAGGRESMAQERRESMAKKGDTPKRQLMVAKLEALATSTPYAPEAQAAKAKAEELKIHRVTVQVRPATDGGNPGEVAIRHYFVEGGNTVVMCDADGAPLHHWEVSCRVALLPDQTAEQVARRLTRDMHRGGDTHGFYRRLRYPSGGAPV